MQICREIISECGCLFDYTAEVKKAEMQNNVPHDVCASLYRITVINDQ
jgi:hypothetical protein